MATRAAIIWVIGLFTWVPYGTYYLFFHAERDQYALFIVGVLFWIFGYWGVVGPLLSALKVRRVFKAIETAQSREKLLEIIRSQQSEDMVIDFIATENRIPRFLARRLYTLFIQRFGEQIEDRLEGKKPNPTSSAPGPSTGH